MLWINTLGPHFGRGEPAQDHQTHNKVIFFFPFLSQPSSDTASCSASGLTGGPIISDVTDMSQASMALQMQPEEAR